jgi:hypothetical protein
MGKRAVATRAREAPRRIVQAVMYLEAPDQRRRGRSFGVFAMAARIASAIWILFWMIISILLAYKLRR